MICGFELKQFDVSQECDTWFVHFEMEDVWLHIIQLTLIGLPVQGTVLFVVVYPHPPPMFLRRSHFKQNISLEPQTKENGSSLW